MQILKDEPLRFLANKPKAVEEEDEVIFDDYFTVI